MTENARRYYSSRTGTTTSRINLPRLKKLYLSLYEHFGGLGYFDEAFGYGCVDGNVDGRVGSNVEAYVDLRTMQPGLWPLRSALTNYTEVQLFDMIEFMFDHVSKPTAGWEHTFCNCGMHWSKFDSPAGRTEYRDRVNPLLESYLTGFTLNGSGEIIHHAPAGMGKLLAAQLPTGDQTVSAKVRSAIDRFQRYGTTLDERANAVRDLADVLEWLRPQIKTALLREDENELFNLANKFGIRHMNQNQKVQYDRAIWLSWMFYHYLATINACLHLLGKQEATALPAATK